MAKKAKMGRPKHADPPKALMTNIPTSLYEQLDRLVAASGRPKSEHLAAALRAYLKAQRRRG